MDEWIFSETGPSCSQKIEQFYGFSKTLLLWFDCSQQNTCWHLISTAKPYVVAVMGCVAVMRTEPFLDPWATEPSWEWAEGQSWFGSISSSHFLCPVMSAYTLGALPSVCERPEWTQLNLELPTLLEPRAEWVLPHPRKLASLRYCVTTTEKRLRLQI